MFVLKRVFLCLLLSTIAAAQAPERTFPPSAATQSVIQTKLAELTQRIDALTAKRTDPALLADVAIYQKAAQFILRYPEEFFTAAYVPETVRALDTGMARVKELESGTASWAKKAGHVVRGYVSRVDGSVQPYGLTIPASYNGSRPMRLDVWLHGTQLQLNEVRFLTQQEAPHETSQIPAEDYIQLEPLGRMNLSYRYAGETDVFEAVESVRSRYNIDPKRVVIRGHSMGGQGAWHLGLQHSGKWAAVESSAGYVKTYTQAKRVIRLPLPAYQVPTLTYYDAVEYALNAFNVPTVGYIGETDGNAGPYEMRDAWMKEGFRFRQETPYRWTTRDLRALFLVGPKTGHSWHPESKAESEAFIRRVLQDADKVPNRIRCVTFTTRFNECHWVTIGGLDEHYVRAEVDASRTDDLKTYLVTTTNVSRLTFTASPAVYEIDGQTLKAGANPTFDRNDRTWTIARGRPAGLRKVHGLQGPIDDAFMAGFLAVRGTGQPWNQAVHDYAHGRFDTLKAEFAKWVRGDIRVKDDAAVSPEDIAKYNLILFGDPGSNRMIAKVMSRMPIQWTQSEIAVGAQTFPAATRALVMIYPNPLNPERYVVVNSGHTFSVDRLAATTESMFVPRLGDYAVVTVKGEVATSGFFDESWKLK